MKVRRIEITPGSQGEMFCLKVIRLPYKDVVTESWTRFTNTYKFLRRKINIKSLSSSSAETSKPFATTMIYNAWRYRPSIGLWVAFISA